MKKSMALAAALMLVAVLPAQAKQVWIHKHVQTVRADAEGGGWLGIVIAHTEIQENGGPIARELKVAKVFEDSPAAQAGFQQGDVLVSIDGETVTSANEFIQSVRGRESGDALTAVVLRDGREVTLNARLGDRPDLFFGHGGANSFVFKLDKDGEHSFEMMDFGDMSFQFGALKEGLMHLGDAEIILRNVLKCDDESPCTAKLAFQSRPRLGVRVEPLTDQLAEFFDVDGGLLVTQVIEGSAADDAGLEAGDVILRVSGEEIRNISELRRALAKVELPGTARIDVSRHGRSKSYDAQLDASTTAEGSLFDMRFQPRKLDRSDRLKL